MTHINDTLWNLWKTAEFHYTSPEEKRAQVDAYDGGSDCGTIHEYTISDLRNAIKTIRREHEDK